MRVYFRIEVSGAHHIPASGPFILAPVHRSRWDPFMVYCAVAGRILYFMTSHDEVVGLQGWVMRRVGAFAINTQRPSSSVMRRCKELICHGEALVIFPEGNLFYYAPGEVHPLKPGVAWLALNCQKELGDVDIPIIPVRLVYSERKLRPGSRARIVVGEPIAVSGFTGLPLKEGMLALTAALQSVLGEVVNQTSSAESLRECQLSGRSGRRSIWVAR
jgi:1-acyl-sn-glycerol-3-phosphate acyltransferase